MPGMFDFLRIFRQAPPGSAPLSYSTCNAFQHRFTDSRTRFPLVSLTIGDCDWGRHARFTPPQLDADGRKLYAWEVKWVPPLCDEPDLPQAGWVRREVLVDLVERSFAASPWKKIVIPPVHVKPRWTLDARPRAITAFRSPVMFRGDPVGRVTAGRIEYTRHGESGSVDWEALSVIHFSKQAVDTNHLPVLQAILGWEDGDVTVSLPEDPAHPLYRQLITRGLLSPDTLRDFLDADDERWLTVLSTLGDLGLGPLDDATAAALAAANLPGPVDLNGLSVPRLEVSRQESHHAHLPPRRFFFRFSTVNGEAHPARMKDEVKRWAKSLAGGWSVEFHANWSTFLQLRGTALELELSYDRSAGFGSLAFAPGHYRRMLRADPRYRTDFAPRHSFAIRSSGIDSVYGFAPGCILPVPEPLYRSNLTAWRDDTGRCGIAYEDYLYLWQAADVEAIADEVSDEYGDRGGPHYHIALRFKGGATLTVKAGDAGAAQLQAFFDHTDHHGARHEQHT